MIARPSSTGNAGDPGRRTLEGAVRLFLAEGLIVPTGLVTLAFLTRWLGTTNYGLFTLAATTVTWLEWSLTALSARATNKCISEATDWEPVATTALRLHMATGLVAMVALMLGAGWVATQLGEPALAGYLRLLALDIPVFSLAQAHRNILVGLGGYRQRAWLSAGRWVGRLVLILLFVGAGWGVPGAIGALIGASVVELIVARRFVKPSLWRRSDFPVQRLLVAAAPLFLLGICLRLFDKVDLFILKALGAPAAQAGLYGAVQNLTIVPGLFALSFSPLLLSTLTRLRRDGQQEHARAMARDSLRLAILLLPWAAMVAGAAPEIVRLVAGPKFTDAAPLLPPLIFSAIASVLISVATVVLIASNRSWWTVVVGVSTLAAAVGGQFWAIPRWGAQGAANVTAGCAWLGAVLAVALAAADWKTAPPVWSVVRSLVWSGVAFAAAGWWVTPGAWVVVKMAALSAGLVAGYVASGELDARERALAWSLILWNRNSPS